MKPINGSWNSIKCSLNDIRIDILLTCGQSFRWKETEPKVYTSVLNNKVWTLKQTENELLYKVYEPEGVVETTKLTKIGSVKRAKTESKKPGKKLKTEEASIVDANEAFLKDYFQLGVDLKTLYQKWSDADSNFKNVAPIFKGIRMLRQDPTENLISFICSSNNNISRISGMVEKLCLNYGEKILDLDGHSYHAFPSLEKLSDKKVESKLRQLGFGYRAKYIQQTAQYITQECPPNWLENLRKIPYEEAHQSLVKLSGVGAKVADCVCLMSLDKHEAIPVDTHVWQIACRDYLPGLKKNKSLTDRTYKEIGDHFRKLFGEYAGWAHSVLFSADLKKFKDIKEV